MSGADVSVSPDTELPRSIWHSLKLRLILFLSLALLPLGIIAVMQAERLREELLEAESLQLQLTTAEVAEREREAIASAIGAARGLGATAARLPADEAACSAFFERFVSQSDGAFVFAGLLPRSGIVTCSSSDKTHDFSGEAAFQALLEAPRVVVDANPSAPLSQKSVVVVSVPYGGEGGAAEGFISVSIPHERLVSEDEALIGDQPIDVFTVNQSGDVLTGAIPFGGPARDRLLQRVADYVSRNASGAIEHKGENGRTFTVSIAPIVDGRIYAVGLWRQTEPAAAWARFLNAAPALFPIAMWLSGLALVYLAVDRQVARPVRRLARRMRKFGQSRKLVETPAPHLPSELRVIDTEFSEMADKIVRDEANIMDMLHEKEVLFKELNHRVKNNLQLIASITSMYERRSRDAATKMVLASVNQRIASMATVHKALYSVDALSRIKVDELLDRVVAPLTDLAPRTVDGQKFRFQSSFEPASLYPDHAMPLSLLCVELVTNALKYVGAPSGEVPFVEVGLSQAEGGAITLVVRNSLTAQQHEALAAADEPASSLGTRLINSFVRQLGGTAHVAHDSGAYTVSVEFEAPPFDVNETTVTAEID